MNSPKSQDWQALGELTQGRAIVVERVRLVDRDVVIEGAFEPPKLCRWWRSTSPRRPPGLTGPKSWRG